ncbi:MAG: rane-bound serine protease (ClpP class) [Actinomycetia bacterium]|nr:rane-bound serine protease (ClpP class) [Actinomycetes bacterium]
MLQVEGLIDPPNASLILGAIRDANRAGSTLLILQVDSSGAVDVDSAKLVAAVRDSKVPVAVWVGPSGAHARGLAAALLAVAPVASASNGSSVGPLRPLRLDRPDDKSVVKGRVLADGRRRALALKTYGATYAKQAGVVDSVEPTIGEFIVSLNNKTVDGHKLSTARVVGTGQGRRLEPNQQVNFGRLSLPDQALHTLIRPSVAYFLFVVGLALIVFEFFTVGVGLAGATGALAVVGAFTGLSHLPVQWWALGLLVVAILGFTIDVQAGGLGPWTFLGGAALVAGSLLLYGGSSRLDPAWWIIALVVVGTVVFMLGAMTAVIRARFSTPTIGREGMVGELGDAEVDVAPDGVVTIRGSRWQARTNRATPIRAGDRVRVVEVAGFVLEVEPEEGGAKDYRDRGPRTAADGGSDDGEGEAPGGLPS